MSDSNNCTEFVCSDYPAIYNSYVYLFTSIVLVGIIFNSATFLVLSLESRRFKRYGIFFVFVHRLSISDLLYLTLFSCVGICNCYEVQTGTGLDACNVYMAFIYRPLANTFYAVSVWITVTMALERYSLLKKSNSFVTKLNTEYINWVVILFYVAMFIVHIPFYFYE